MSLTKRGLFQGCRFHLVFFFFNGTAKTKLAIFAFFYAGEFVTNSNKESCKDRILMSHFLVHVNGKVVPHKKVWHYFESKVNRGQFQALLGNEMALLNRYARNCLQLN